MSQLGSVALGVTLPACACIVGCSQHFRPRRAAPVLQCAGAAVGAVGESVGAAHSPSAASEPSLWELLPQAQGALETSGDGHRHEQDGAPEEWLKDVGDV